MTNTLRGFTGRMIRDSVKIVMLFKVRGVEYPATPYNSELMETYLHTGDTMYLDQLESAAEAVNV